MVRAMPRPFLLHFLRYPSTTESPVGHIGRRILLALLVTTIPFLVSTSLEADDGPTSETRIFYLSGQDVDDTVLWEFRCDKGRRCGSWQPIEVPSHWEQQGFGEYNYGHDEDKHAEIGEYRTRFRLPADWQEQRVDLVFDGVMTDAEVKVNGRSAGPKHQGAFYPFRYDVTDLLKPFDENLLEVKVWKVSADKSVEKAERDADYWVFGGIFRPVRLEGFPAQSIEHVAYDPRHDGRLSARVRFREPLNAASILRLERLDAGDGVAESLQVDVGDGTGEASLDGRFDVLPWSAETPRLYRFRLTLERPVGPSSEARRILHRVEHRLGFRTVEVDAQRGLLINGRAVRLKGVNRHTFHPKNGRATNRRLDREDARRIKDLHMNAVRMSHYPPDPSFLDACDEIGLYVLDELAGWHDAYGTAVGRPLVKAMVERDVNRPSIIFWDNGNEDGWNTELDGDFALHDPQGRRVLHPRSLFEGIDTMHYLDWSEMQDRFDDGSLLNRWRGLWGPLPLVMPTEILHGLYDGGSAAGLEDYWRLVRSSPRGMGLFLWAFTDEAVERTDRQGEFDTDGNHAPDGVLGPYRERSGNEIAIRRIFAPVRMEPVVEAGTGDWNGRLELENRFDHLDLSAARLFWWLLEEDELSTADPPTSVPSRPILSIPAAAPGERATVELPLPDDLEPFAAVHVRLLVPREDALADSFQSLTVDRRFPLRSAMEEARRLATEPGPTAMRTTMRKMGDGGTRLVAGDHGLELDADGRLRALVNGGIRFELPLFHASGQESAPRPTAFRILEEIDEPAKSVGFETRFAGDDDGNGLIYLRGRLFPGGWLRLSWQTRHHDQPLPGIVLPLDVETVRSARWTGLGPTRIWGNRPQGVWGRWSAGAEGAVAPHQAHEPQFTGYYAARELELQVGSGRLHIVSEQDRALGLWQPTFPDDAKDARAEVHRPNGLAFLDAAPAVGTKFHPAENLGPQSRPMPRDGLHGGAIWLRFGAE